MMRTIAVTALAAVLAVSACAPKVVPAPVVSTPRFPDFIRPAVPAAYASSPAVAVHDRGWAFLQAGDLRSAAREAGLALRAAPDFYPAETLAGYVELAGNHPGDALERFDRALARDAVDLAALTGRGHALAALDRETEAVQAYEAVLNVDPSAIDLRRRVEVLRFRGLQRDLEGARQAAKGGRTEAAIRAYQAAIASSPESPFLYRELAAVERQAGNLAPAIEHYRRALALEPGDAASVAAIAGILEERGEVEEALRTYDEALALEPNPAIGDRRDRLRARLELARLPDQYRAIDGAAQVSRADLAALIGVRIPLSLQGGPARDPGVITDVRGHWAEPWIMTTARDGVMEAFANHTFQPESTVRRVDLAQAVSRLLARVADTAQLRAWQSASVRFADVPPGHLAYPAASVVVAANIMQTAPGGTFDLSRPVTGAEAIEAVERVKALAPPPASTPPP